jgi:hypothetical protein
VNVTRTFHRSICSVSYRSIVNLIQLLITFRVYSRNDFRKLILKIVSIIINKPTPKNHTKEQDLSEFTPKVIEINRCIQSALSQSTNLITFKFPATNQKRLMCCFQLINGRQLTELLFVISVNFGVKLFCGYLA